MAIYDVLVVRENARYLFPFYSNLKTLLNSPTE